MALVYIIATFQTFAALVSNSNRNDCKVYNLALAA